jgi:hypothetical protein
MKVSEIAKLARENARQAKTIVPNGSEPVPIDIEDMIERAFEQAFMKAFEEILQNKAEVIFKKVLGNGSIAKKLEEKIEKGLETFFQEGIRWDKKKPGFKK